jgi:hypothetical protein
MMKSCLSCIVTARWSWLCYWLLFSRFVTAQEVDWSIIDRALQSDQAAILEQTKSTKTPQFAALLQAHTAPLAAERYWLPRPRTVTNKSDEATQQLYSEWLASRTPIVEQRWQWAKQAISVGNVTRAWELLHRILVDQPNHIGARLLLGYRFHQQAWHRPPTVALLQAGKVDHPQFGWMSEEDVKRYESGQRFYRGNWISMDKEMQLRTTIQNGWRIETPHYQLTTNYSLDEGLRMARRLEELVEAWQQLFPLYFVSPKDLQQRLNEVEKLLAAKTADPQTVASKLPAWSWEQRKFNVVLLATRDEYNQQLKAAQPNIAQTLGIYFASTKTAYFFVGRDQDPGTVLHEATHQLFQESARTSNTAGATCGFWMLEAVACYMETLETIPQGWFVGGTDTLRVKAARQRLLRDQFYVPLAELNAKSMKQLQADPNLPKIYSQSAGLWQFLMHAQAGRFRAPALQSLQMIYRPAPPVQARDVEQLWPLKSEELDTAYREYLKQFGAP